MPRRSVAVFGASTAEPDDPLYEAACRLGGRLATDGWTVFTGGYAGVMAAVSQGAAEAGGRVVGVTAPAVFPHRSGANRWVHEERSFSTVTERIHHLVDSTDASIALSGSIGTLAELLAAWNAGFVAPLSGRTPKPVVAVGSPWGMLVPYLAGTLATDPSFVTVVDTVDEAADRLARMIAPETRNAADDPRSGRPPRDGPKPGGGGPDTMPGD